MHAAHDLTLFLVAAWALIITPGPDMLYVIARSMGQGRAAGVTSALGIFTGCFVHIFAVAFGLAGVLRTVPIAYDAVRYAGAAYLIYLGLKMLLSKESRSAQTDLQPLPLKRIFWQGVLTDVLNPKVALFFLAFLPQFINVKHGPVVAATIFLGVLFNVGGTIVNLTVAAIASYSSRRVLSPFLDAHWFRWCTGGVFTALGIRLAFAGRR